MFERIVIVSRKTRLEELVERFNSRPQAQFYIEHAGGDFSEYVREDDAYRRSMDAVQKQASGLKLQTIDRGFVPTFLFNEKDIVVPVGQDGLVANTAKYVGAQPIIAVNPDPERFDGVLLPFAPQSVQVAVRRLLESKAKIREVTLAEAVLSDGQRLLAFNELFIGASSHVSARYRIAFSGQSEAQSSSGVLVSTGAGSTGWLSSVFNMVGGIASTFTPSAKNAPPCTRINLAWEDPRLVFVVREPFASKHSRTSIAAGLVAPQTDVTFESLMPSGGVIFSDGVEADFVQFNAGATAHVRAAAQRARLVVA